jgi:hypothetical protein
MLENSVPGCGEVFKDGKGLSHPIILTLRRRGPDTNGKFKLTMSNNLKT